MKVSSDYMNHSEPYHALGMRASFHSIMPVPRGLPYALPLMSKISLKFLCTECNTMLLG